MECLTLNFSLMTKTRLGHPKLNVFERNINQREPVDLWTGEDRKSLLVTDEERV